MSSRVAFATLVFAVLLSSCSSPSDVRPGQCHPCIVSAKVGPLVKEAQTLAQAKDYQGALAKLDEAEAVKYNPDDTTVINQMKHYIVVASADTSTLAGAKAKFAYDYNDGRFADVIDDGELLRKFNALDPVSQLIIGQAYYKKGDYAGCVKYAKTLNSDVARQLEARCAYEIGHRPQP